MLISLIKSRIKGNYIVFVYLSALFKNIFPNYSSESSINFNTSPTSRLSKKKIYLLLEFKIKLLILFIF